MPEPRPSSFIGRSPALRRAIECLERVAPTDAGVLLLGETGTGKERGARLLHDRSARADGPFVAVNCAALPDGLVESELFGHEAGAFTGALRRSLGRIEQAHRGTLFLDEVGDLSSGGQAKLLRVLQEHAVERLGCGRAIEVDVRIVAATNRDLGAEVARGTFRADLYFRLAVVAIELPPLREREGDVELLARHFLGVAAERFGRVVTLDERALARLAQHDWPGNVRELENLCTRVVALAADGAIVDEDDLGLPRRAPLAAASAGAGAGAGAGLHELLDLCEREIVDRALERASGNRTRAAATLGISRQALQQKLARFRGVA